MNMNEEIHASFTANLFMLIFSVSSIEREKEHCNTLVLVLPSQQDRQVCDFRSLAAGFDRSITGVGSIHR